MKEKQQSKKVSSKTTTKRDPEDIGAFGEVEKKTTHPWGSFNWWRRPGVSPAMLSAVSSSHTDSVPSLFSKSGCLATSSAKWPSLAEQEEKRKGEKGVEIAQGSLRKASGINTQITHTTRTVTSADIHPGIQHAPRCSAPFKIRGMPSRSTRRSRLPVNTVNSHCKCLRGHSTC